MAVLDLTDVTCTRGDASAGEAFRVTVNTLSIDAGDAVAIVGQSGSGKSTILDMLAGILKPVSAGTFALTADDRHHDLAAYWQADAQPALREVRARHLGYVLQTGGLAPFLTIAENVALPFWRDGTAGGPEIDTLLGELGIAEHARKLPRDVSVGQRQRAAIARALVTAPSVVLADEPTASLDADTAEGVMTLLCRSARDRGAALIVVTHDRELAERHGLRIENCAPAGPGRSTLGGTP